MLSGLTMRAVHRMYRSGAMTAMKADGGAPGRGLPPGGPGFVQHKAQLRIESG